MGVETSSRHTGGQKPEIRQNYSGGCSRHFRIACLIAMPEGATSYWLQEKRVAVTDSDPALRDVAFHEVPRSRGSEVPRSFPDNEVLRSRGPEVISRYEVPRSRAPEVKN